jgi:hypothetical protein
MKIYFEKIINKERGRKFRVHYRWQAPENKLDIYSHRESGLCTRQKILPTKIYEAEDFRKSKFEEIKRLKKSKISRSQKYMKPNISGSRRLKKSMFEEVED